MIVAKPGQIVLTRRKDSPPTPTVERKDSRPPGVTLDALIERWKAGSGRPVIDRELRWEIVAQDGAVISVVSAPSRELAREMGQRATGGGQVLVRYIGTRVHQAGERS